MINFQPDIAATRWGISRTQEVYSQSRFLVGYASLSQVQLHNNLEITPHRTETATTLVGQSQYTYGKSLVFKTSTAVKKSHKWEYTLPNGTYNVSVGVGDKPQKI